MTTLTPEQIRDGIDCADGFDLTENHYTQHLTLPSGHYFTVNSADDFRPWMLAALASQLISQVEDDEIHTVTEYVDHTVVEKWEGGISQIVAYAEGIRRDENSILACTELFRSLK